MAYQGEGSGYSSDEITGVLRDYDAVAAVVGSRYPELGEEAKQRIIGIALNLLDRRRLEQGKDRFNRMRFRFQMINWLGPLVISLTALVISLMKFR